jgi:hypothetical protein
VKRDVTPVAGAYGMAVTTPRQHGGAGQDDGEASAGPRPQEASTGPA